MPCIDPLSAPALGALVPAVLIKRSVTPDFIVRLEDGKTLKSLKRHLRTAYGLSPDDYRAKWNLPAEYPMVAPNYAAARSALATSMGLGQRRKKVAVSTSSPVATPSPSKPTPKGRKSKA